MPRDGGSCRHRPGALRCAYVSCWPRSSPLRSLPELRRRPPGVNASNGLGDLAATPRRWASRIARVFVDLPVERAVGALVVRSSGTTTRSSTATRTRESSRSSWSPAAARRPQDVNSYAQYVGVLAARYAGKVAAYEIWNEEDSILWWGADGGNPGVYAALLRATYGQVGHRAPVVLGGLTGNNYAFLEQVYGALGGNSGDAFDAVGVHTDTACSIVGPDSFFRNPDGRISQ